MPVDTSKDPSSDTPRARTGQPSTRAKDARRERGEISCAECRRLKLRCDKKLPCTSCTRRGCATICPTGTLATGQGTRFILADTAELHATIIKMGERIRQLEAALSNLQSMVSAQPHPLLQEPLLSIKYGVDADISVPPPGEGTTGVQTHPVEPPSSLVETFGTMAIGDRTESKYFGPASGSEVMLMEGASVELGPDSNDAAQGIPLEIRRLPSFLSIGLQSNIYDTLDILFKYLPNESRARALCHNYLEYSASAFRPVTKEELIEEFLTPTYKRWKVFQAELEAGVERSRLLFVCPHKLAVLFLAFALGVMVDPHVEPDNQESNLYFRLSCCALGVRAIFDSPETSTVQAISMLAMYHGAGGKWYTLDSSWMLTQLALVVAHSLGMRKRKTIVYLSENPNISHSNWYSGDLDRDPAKWTKNTKVIQRRRALFWELMSNDEFFSCSLGRPPYVHLYAVDTEYPDDSVQADTLPGFFRWKYEYMGEIFPVLLKSLLSPQAPSYATVVDIDRLIREKPTPAHFDAANSNDLTSVGVHFQRWYLVRYRAISLLFLHRRYFVQAMLDHSKDPLQSPFAPSFLATYQAASEVIKSTFTDLDRFPRMSSRYWGLWTHLFSATIVVGSIVIHSPHCAMAPSAFIELGLACMMFDKGAETSMRARSGLAIIHKIRDKANQAYARLLVGARTGDSVGRSIAEDSDELSTFGGQKARILISNILSRHSNPPRPEESTSSPDESTTSPSSPEAQEHYADTAADAPEHRFHPALVDFLGHIQSSSWEGQVASSGLLTNHVEVPQDPRTGSSSAPGRPTEIWTQGQTWSYGPVASTSSAQPSSMHQGSRDLSPGASGALENNQQYGGAHDSEARASWFPDTVPQSDATGQWMSFVHAYGLSGVVGDGPEVQIPNFPFQY